MPASPAAARRRALKNPYRALTWEQWAQMSWRERQRVREHREPPRPPRQAFIALDEKQNRQLERLARARKRDVDELITDLVVKYLKRQESLNARARKQVKERSA